MFNGSWDDVIDLGGTVISATSTEFIIENTDGTYTRAFGTGFTYPGGQVSGTFTSIERFDPTSSITLISYTGISRDFTTAFDLVADQQAFEATLNSFALLGLILDNEFLTASPTLYSFALANGMTIEVIGTGMNHTANTIAGMGTVTEVRIVDTDGTTVVQTSGAVSFSMAAVFSNDPLALYLSENTPTITTDASYIHNDFSIYGGSNTFAIGGSHGGTLDFSSSDVGVTADLATNYVDRGNTGGNTDSLTGSYNVIDGSDFNDYLLGNANANFLYGGDGNDTIIGQAGDDFIDAGGGGGNYIETGTGFDTVTFKNSGGSYNTLSYQSLDAAIIVDFTHANSLGTVNKGVNGFDEIQFLNHTTYVDAVIGGLGVHGTAFDDIFNIDINEGYTGTIIANWMQILGNAGDDTFNISPGYGRIQYYNSPAGIVADLAAGTVQDGFGNVDTINGIDKNWGWEIQGSDFADILTGSAYDDRFIGRQGNDIIDGGAGFDRLRYNRSGVDAIVVDTVAGTVTGTWGGNAFTDTISNIEWILGSRNDNDLFNGSSADERFEGQGGNDTLNGAGGNDILYGGDGDDIINGGAGDDRLGPGAGTDTLTGGADADTFYSNVGYGINTVTDFTSADGDKLDVSGHQVFGFNFLNINSINGGLDTQIDFGGGDQYIFTGVNSASLTAADFVFFTPKPVATITQSAGGDIAEIVVTEGQLNHTISGATSATQFTTQHNSIAGVSTVYDGFGFTFTGVNITGGTITAMTFIDASGTRATITGLSADAVGLFDAIADANGGDFIALDRAFDSYDFIYDASGASAGVDFGNSGSFSNFTITGSDFTDSLQGGKGDDLIDPGTGGSNGDLIIGSGGNDTIDYTNVSGAYQHLGYWNNLDEVRVHVTATQATVHKGIYGFDTIQNLDSVIGSGTGGFGIQGSNYDDVFVLDGGAGSWMQVLGGRGDDYIKVLSGQVRINYHDATAGVTVDLDQGFAHASDGSVGHDNFEPGSIWEVRGSNFDDTLIGSASDESFITREGNDTVDGGGGIDRITYNRSGVEQLSVNLENGNASGTWNGNSFNDTLTNIENIRGSNANYDYLIGSSADNIIEGMDGNDFLTGMAGNDILDGGNGNRDIANFAEESGGGFNTVDLINQTATDTYGDSDTLIDIEGARAGNFGSLLIGTNGDNQLHGGDGNDTIVTGDSIGGDQVEGSAGNDIINYSAAITGYQGINYSQLSAGLTATINMPTNTASVNKGVNGFDNIININNPITGGWSSGGFGFRGTDHDDVINLFTNASTWMQVDGAEGNDTYNIDPLSAGIIRLNLRSYGQTTNGVNVNLATGIVSDDGFGFVDTINGNFSEIHGTDFDDIFVGSTLNERFITGGGNDSVDGGDGKDSIRYDRNGVDNLVVDLDAGTATGTWNGNAFSDTLINIEDVRGSKTNDDHITGDAGNNDLNGSGGNDTLIGGAGDDFLQAGSGTDFIDGGTNNFGDELSYGYDGSATGITATFTGVGAGTVIDWNGDTDTFINIEIIRATAHVDILTGSNGDERFRGLAGDDIIDGGGQTEMFGDWVRHDQDAKHGGSAGVTVNLDTGIAIDGFGDTDTLISIESVTGTDQNDSLTGNALANYFFARGGDDNLFGLAGDDTFAGNNGNDLLDGGADTDTIDYQYDYFFGTTNGITVDLLAGTATDSFGGTDTLISIENIVATDFDDTLSGNDDDNNIVAAAGMDTISGGYGSDTIDAGDDDDTIAFTEDAANRVDIDIWDGGAGTDTGDYSNFHSAVSINLTANHEGYTRDNSNVGSGVWRVITEIDNVENLIGSAFDDRLTGDNGANVLMGMGGNDILKGGVGNDSLFGGDGDDILYGNQSTDMLDGGFGDDWLFMDGLDTSVSGGEGYDRLSVQASLGVNVNMNTAGIERADGNNGDDVFDATGKSDFSVFIKGFNGNDTLTGSLLGDVIFGGNNDDTISGSDGNDRLYGQSGADSLSGGNGNDRLYADADDTFIDGGAGIDQVIVQSGNGITINTATSNVEKVFGSNSAASGDNLSAVGATITTVLYGRAGDDFLTGGNATDLLRGGVGDDVLNGGTGGNDRLFGGAGSNNFEFNTSWGRDKIEGGFNDGSDMMVFDGVLDSLGGTLDFSDLTIVDDGGNAKISITGGGPDTITILGFDYTLLDVSDFTFI